MMGNDKREYIKLFGEEEETVTETRAYQENNLLVMGFFKVSLNSLSLLFNIL